MRFELDPNFEPLMRRSTGLRNVISAYAEEVAGVARGLAPRRNDDLRNSIEAEVGLDQNGILGRVNAHDFKAHWIEFGTVRTPAQPYLRPAAEQVLGPLLDLRGGR